MRRKYQQGYVYQKHRRKDEPWLKDEPAYVLYWRDVLGQADAKRAVLALGNCKTRTIAERRAAEKLEALGINSAQSFIEATPSVTFKEQGEIWLKSLATRKRNPVEQTTINTRRCALDKWIYPFFSGRYLGQINNLAMKELVEHMAHSLAPATIREYKSMVKDVVASALNEDGEELFPRKWNEEFIDAPIIEDQNQPTTTRTGIEGILGQASGQCRVLYALLAGCGPLRVGEALGLDIRNVSEDFRTLTICQKAKNGIIRPFLKTKNGNRLVELPSNLAAVLKEHIGNRTSGLVFCTSTGAQIQQGYALRASLHPILRSMDHEIGGFNIFRRFRLTHLEKSDCPEALKNFWSGHAPRHISERYIKLLNDREYRLDWAERIGLGFSVGIPGILHAVPRVA